MMTMHGGRLWAKHPAVRTGTQLSPGERAADGLKAIFGTWTLLFAIIIGICLWMTFAYDPGELHLNLALSFLASVQGVILQIAANRGDRIAAEVALHTQGNTDALTQQSGELLTLQNRQMDMLAGIEQLEAKVDLLLRAVIPPASPPQAAAGAGASGETVPPARRTPKTTKPNREPK